MLRPRGVVPLLVLICAACFTAWGQSVVSTHSGLVYFFEGSVFIGDQPLEQKFGKFPDIGEGGELRTEHGRAEVLLSPGVALRLDENSRIRMISTSLADTRVELLGGSAIFEANEAAKNTSSTLLYKDWLVRLPEQGVFRINSEPARIQVYKGRAEISTDGNHDVISVQQGQVVPFAAVLVPEQSPIEISDTFKNWAMDRSQAVSSDNAMAAEITDDPNQVDSAGLPTGALSYFPLTGIPGVAITNPYGLSFWSPFQSGLTSIYLSPSIYRSLYSGWPAPIRYRYPSLFPGGSVTRSPIGIGLGARPGGISTRVPYIPPPRTAPRPITPHVGMRGGRR